MQRIRLVGRYKLDVKMPCHFEDIPVFFKMADLGEENIYFSDVFVSSVKETSYIITPSPIARWKIVMTKNGKLVLAYRTYFSKAELPSIYRVIRVGSNFLLKNVSTVVKADGSRRNGFERLKMYYEYNEKIYDYV